MKRGNKTEKWTVIHGVNIALITLLLSISGKVRAQQSQGKIVFEDNFDNGKSFEELGYRTGAAQDMTEKPLISANKSASEKNSVFFPVKRLNMRKKFDAAGISNIIFEWKVNVPELGGSFAINLYNSRDAVVKTNLFSKNFIYINEANEKVALAPYNANEWLTFRIEITGNKYNVYMNNKLIGENIPTLNGHTKANTIFYSVGNKAAYVDDIRILTKGE